MTRVGKAIGILITVAPFLAVGGCAALVARYERAFEATTDGEQTSFVVDRFGEPTVRELPAEHYLRYAGRACQAPCALRNAVRSTHHSAVYDGNFPCISQYDTKEILPVFIMLGLHWPIRNRDYKFPR